MGVSFGGRFARPLAVALAVALSLGVWPANVLGANGPVFTTQPVGGVAGQLLAVQPIVSIEHGNSIDTGAAGTIQLSLKIGQGTPGAILTCAGSGPGGTTFPVNAGVARAVGCKVDLAGTGYVMTAVYSAGGSDGSNPFTVSSATTNRLAFTTQPGGGGPGTAWAIQPVVTVQDASGVTVTTSSATVSLAITPGTGTAGAVLTCGNTLSRTAVNGVAAFSGCAIDRVGTGYTLTATATGIAAATSAPFAIASAGAATKVGFTTQPARGVPSLALATQPVVAIQDATGATVTSSSASVTLALGANPGGGSLTCTGGNPRAALGGVAAFSGCSVDRIGIGYTLTAASSGLTGATSAPFDVADRLAFTTQPAGAAPGVPFTTQPVVAIRAGTSIAIHDQGTLVTLSIKPGTGAGGANLSCPSGPTRTAVNGVATFSGCSINLPSGTNPYQLVASATNLASATSSPFVVGVSSSTAITVTPSASTITWGGAVTLTTRFASSGANRTFQLWGARDNRNPANFALIATLTTNPAGVSTFVYTPVTNLYYEARFPGAADLGAATSPQARVVVRQISVLRPTNSGAVRSIARNTRITFTTTVRPSRPELTPATVTYWVYRKVGSAWQPYHTVNVAASATGVATFAWAFSSSGLWYVRSMANPTPYNANSVKSPAEQFSVR